MDKGVFKKKDVINKLIIPGQDSTTIENSLVQPESILQAQPLEDINTITPEMIVKMQNFINEQGIAAPIPEMQIQAPTTPLNVPPVITTTPVNPTTPNISNNANIEDYSGISFNAAFAKARAKAGNSNGVFTWNHQTYGTEYASEAKDTGRQYWIDPITNERIDDTVSDVAKIDNAVENKIISTNINPTTTTTSIKQPIAGFKKDSTISKDISKTYLNEQHFVDSLRTLFSPVLENHPEQLDNFYSKAKEFYNADSIGKLKIVNDYPLFAPLLATKEGVKLLKGTFGDMLQEGYSKWYATTRAAGVVFDVSKMAASQSKVLRGIVAKRGNLPYGTNWMVPKTLEIKTDKYLPGYSIKKTFGNILPSSYGSVSKIKNQFKKALPTLGNIASGIGSALMLNNILTGAREEGNDLSGIPISIAKEATGVALSPFDLINWATGNESFKEKYLRERDLPKYNSKWKKQGWDDPYTPKEKPSVEYNGNGYFDNNGNWIPGNDTNIPVVTSKGIIPSKYRALSKSQDIIPIEGMQWKDLQPQSTVENNTSGVASINNLQYQWKRKGSDSEKVNNQKQLSDYIKPEYVKTFIAKNIGSTSPAITGDIRVGTDRTNLLDEIKSIPNKPKILYTIPDKFSTQEGDSLASVRNQFNLDEGFNYKFLQNQDKIDKQNIEPGTYVVSQHLLDNDLDNNSIKTKDILSRYKDRQLSYLPIYKKIGNDNVSITYKQVKDIKNTDNIASDLRQFKLSDIDFNSSVQSSGYTSGYRSVTTKQGKETPLHYTRKDSYGRHSGNNVVFIYENNGKKYAVDFSGSIDQIQREGERISSKSGVSKDKIIIGIMDAGSYSTSEIFNDFDKYKTQIKSRNLPGFVGSGLAIKVK